MTPLNYWQEILPTWAQIVSVYSANQGLGLLINLVEYSSRNRHCLVDMEYSLDNTCLEDSLMLPADPTQADAAAALASTPPSTAETQGDTSDKPKSTGALAALVKVGAVPGLDKCLSFQITVFTETGGDAGSGQKKKVSTVQVQTSLWYLREYRWERWDIIVLFDHFPPPTLPHHTTVHSAHQWILNLKLQLFESLNTH